MGIVGRTATVVELNTVQGITATLPTDRQDGDLAVVVFGCDSTVANFTGPGGSWVALKAPQVDNSATPELIAAYYQFTPGAAPAASTTDLAGRWTAICQSYAGVDPSNPVDVAQVTTLGNGTTLVATGVTTVTPDAMILSGYMVDSSSRTLTQPGSMTMVKSYTPSAGGQALAVAQELDPTPGATGTRTWTLSGGALDQIAFVTALRPAQQPQALVFTDAAVRRADQVARRGWGAGRALLVRPRATPATVDATIASTFGISASALVDRHADATIASTFAITCSASVSSTRIVCQLEIEFTAGVWTDVTDRLAYRISAVRVRQGRPTEYDDVAAGSLSCALFNDDGALMPDNQGSPWWPNVVAGKRIRWRMTKSEVTYTRFVGWIQAITPDFPSASTIGAVVSITATDALGLLAQRILRSNHTEHLLALARLGGSDVEAYEAVGKTSGFVAVMTNFSGDVLKSEGTAFYNTTDATLSFASDSDVSIGDVAVAPSAVSTAKIRDIFRANMEMIVFHIKTFTSVPTAENGFATLTDAPGTTRYHLMCLTNGNIALRNTNLTVTLGTIGLMPIGQWCRIRGRMNAGNNAESDWQLSTQDGVFLTVTNVAIDVRTVRQIYFPPLIGLNDYPGSSFGGVGAIETGVTIGTPNSFPGSIQGTIVDRIADVVEVLPPMPVTISTLGTLTATVTTGQWSKRNALEVLQEVVRTGSAIAWARSRDSVVYVVGSDQTYPVSLAGGVIDTDGDCQGPPRLVAGSEARPTRVDAEWSAGIATAVDTAAEATGLIRSRRITTIAASAATATAAAQAIIDRSSTANLRICQVTVDLLSADTDHTADLFDESTTLGGLYPTQRVRLAVPTSHFGAPTRDVHVQGWEESYGPQSVTVQMDTTPAIPLEIIPLNTFTAANGAGLPGSFDNLISVGGAGVVEVQSNQARITTAAAVGAAMYVRSTQQASRVDLLVQFTLTSVGSRAAVIIRMNGPAGISTGYRLTADTSGTIVLERNFVTVASWSQQLTSPFPYWLRIRAISQFVNARIWRTSQAQPGAWSLAYVDPDPLTDTRIVLGARSDGVTATARSVDFDDYLVMDDLAAYVVPVTPAPTVLPVFGAVAGQSSAVRAALDRRRRAGSGRVVIERNPG